MKKLSYIQKNIVSVTQDFLIALCRHDSITKQLLNLQDFEYLIGPRMSALSLEKQEILSLYDRMDKEARARFKSEFEDMCVYFGKPDKDFNSESLLSFVSADYYYSGSALPDFSEYKKNLMTMSNKDFIKNFAIALSDYDNSFVKDSTLPETLTTPADIAAHILSLELPSNQKWLMQDILFHRQKHQTRYLAILQRGIDFVLEYENELEAIVSDFYAYWLPHINNDYITFIQNDLTAFLNVLGPVKEFDLRPSLFSNNISLYTDVDEETGEFNGPLTIIISVIYGNTLHPNDVLNVMMGNNQIISEDQCISALKQLSDSSRFDILQYIKNRKAFGGEIATQLGLTTATVSHHMNSLMTAGLLEITRENARVYYTLNRVAFENLLKACEEILL